MNVAMQTLLMVGVDAGGYGMVVHGEPNAMQSLRRASKSLELRRCINPLELMSSAP
jgi:hypothetical protein